MSDRLDRACDLLSTLRERGRALGFDVVRLARAETDAAPRERYRAFIALGRHGTMDWLAREPERREDPRGMWPAARTALVCGTSYAPATDPRPELARRDRGIATTTTCARAG